MRARLAPAMLLAAFSIFPTAAQETRSAIFGRVSDPGNAVIPGTIVAVTNTDTNATVTLASNDTGYFEANLLIAGNYRISAEKPGFRKLVRSGLILSIDSMFRASTRLRRISARSPTTLRAPTAFC